MVLPSQKQLSLDLIRFIKKLKQLAYVPSVANCTVSFNPDLHSGLCTKHYWHVEAGLKECSLALSQESSGAFINLYFSSPLKVIN